ncbi:MAG TPA: ABC transporter ATP-binding protein [Elainellaceae cyanobacterium]
MRIPFKQYGTLLSDYLKPQRGRVIGLAIALLATIALQILNPQLLGIFIDTATTGGAIQTLIAIALAFMAIAVLIQSLAVVTTYFSETVAWTATNALRIDLVDHCLKLDLSFHKSRTPGEWVERVDGDVTALSRFFSQLVIHVFGNGILLVGILVMLFFEDWRAGLGLSLFSGVALLLLLGVQGFAIVPWTAYRQKSAEFFGFIGEQITGREDLRANGAISYVMNRFYHILQDWLPVYHKARFASTLLWSGSVGLFTVGNAIALALVVHLWNQQAITIGTAYLIFHYTNLLSQPIERIREELEQLQQVEASIHRIQELFQLQSNIPNQGHLSLPSGALSVTFENVWFWYPNSEEITHKETPSIHPSTHLPIYPSTHPPPYSPTPPLPHSPTLHSLTFHLPPGQILGILGHTGSGKTTIARLLLRFYEVQRGEIYIGEQAFASASRRDIAQVPLSNLRQRVGMVTQDVQLFQASIRDNLTFFDATIQDKEILQTLNMLGFSDWLNSLPNGLNTVLSSDSAGLSAGQAQLLAFARVFLKNPGLVILDEASSRLDPTTEILIERAVDQLLENRTGIIIAHRLETVKRADQILILEKGQVIEYGDRTSLVQTPTSRFARLLKLGLTESATTATDSNSPPVL